MARSVREAAVVVALLASAAACRPPKPVAIEVDRESAPADGVTEVRIAATIRDEAGRPLEGASVRLSVSGHSNDLFPRAGVTDAEGRFEVQLRSRTAQPKRITVHSQDSAASAVVTFTTAASRCPGKWILGSMPEIPVYATGVIPSDLDGDGAPDVVALGHSAIHVALGKGDGRFGPPRRIATTDSDAKAAVADFDSDGRGDLALSDSDGSSVTIVPDAAASGVVEAAGHFPVITLDVNGDGKMDAAVARTNEFQVFLGDGAGRLSPDGSYPTQLAALAAADLDDDGAADVIGAHSAGGLFVWRGNGDGTLALPTAVHQGSKFTRLETGDVDSDGLVDILASAPDSYGSTPSTLLRSGGGQGYEALALDDVFTSLGDADGDGVLDLFGRSSIAHGSGDGTFGDPVRLFDSLNPKMSIATDLNGDGRADALVVRNGRPPCGYCSSGGVDDLSVALLTPGGGHVGVTQPLPDLGNGSVAIVDLNEDGVSELAGPLQIAQAAADGSVQLRPLVWPSVPHDSRLDFRTGDFDGDGHRDVALWANTYGLNDRGATLFLLYGDGAGSLTSPTLGASAPLAHEVLVGDLTSDGTDDIVVNSEDGGRLAFAGAPPRALAPIEVGVLRDASPLYISDLTDDGLTDVVALPRRWMALAYRGSPDGVFRPRVMLPFSGPPSSITADDFNADGLPDLAGVHADSDYRGWVEVLLGTRSGFVPIWRAQIALALRDQVTVNAGDLDGDGRPDLVVVNPMNNHIVTFVGRGDGSFAYHGGFAVPDYARQATVGDLDGDGASDVAVATYPHGATVLYNRCVD